MSASLDVRRSETGGRSARLRRVALSAATVATLVVLFAHAWHYRFLCDDAFISFRYAVNLAEGHGLVFNPGLERVEGYTNFLWVVVLAALARIGARPEAVANPVLLLATVALWALVARDAWRRTPHGGPCWPALVAPVLLASTRSVAVWSTGGLETRLFEVLTVAAVLRLCVEIDRIRDGRVPFDGGAAVCFALATLTRPDAFLLAGLAMGTGAAWLLIERRLRVHRVVTQAAVYGAIVGAHVLWRRAYYGAWLPNTFHAKVGGRSWADAGWDYLGAFVLEYAVWLWLPALVLGVLWHVRRGTGHVPAIFAVVTLPHLMYVVSIGGDHFEYRPFDLYFPFAFLLIGDGMRWLAATGGARRRMLAAVYVAMLVWGLAWLPWRSHRQFPQDYLAGFPGLQPALASAERFLDPAGDPVYRLPGLRALGAAHRHLVRRTTERFVAVRQESHAAFLDTALAEGRELAELVERGVLPPDTYIATDCAGAIPYVSRLPTLDRLGLNDAHVARSTPGRSGLLAHEKRATVAYASERGVDLWAQDRVHFVVPVVDASVRRMLDDAVRFQDETFFAEVDADRVMVVKLPSGVDSARRRFPRLPFRSSRDAAWVASFRRRIVERAAERLASMPDSPRRRFELADVLAFDGRLEEALTTYLSVPGDAEAAYRAGVIALALGRPAQAIATLERAVTLAPRYGIAWAELGGARLREGRAEEAVAAYRQAVARMPDDPDARFDLGLACLSSGDRPCVDRQIARLDALGTPRARFLAARLRASGKDPSEGPDR